MALFIRDKNRALFDAVVQNDVDSVGRLLSKGADVNARFENDATPLMKAAFSGNLRILRLLIDARADLNCGDQKGYPAQGLSKDRFFPAEDLPD